MSYQVTQRQQGMSLMFRNLLLVCVLLLLPRWSIAQQPDIEVDRDKLNDGQIKSLVLYPAKENVPALKHRLFPSDGELINRNAVLYYHRAIKIGDGLPYVPEFNGKQDVDKFNWMMRCAVSELPIDEVREWISKHASVLRELERARRSSKAVWGILPDPSEPQNWFDFPIPEVQDARVFARMFALKAKLEIAEGRMEDAIKTLQTGYKLACDVGQTKTLIGDLVGIACVGILNGSTYDFIQQPNAPSLYWSLANLPNPMINSRQSIQRELVVISRGAGIKILARPLEKNFSVEKWRELCLADTKAIYAYLEWNRAKPLTIDERISSALVMMRAYPIAKIGLVQSGMSEELVDAMPVVQAVAVYQNQMNTRVLDEYRKTLNLPLRESIEMAGILEKKLYENAFDTFKPGASVFPFLNLLIPASGQVMQADGRSRNRIAALRVLEALRLHLGVTGELPESLSDVNVVPIPELPSTGWPFRYEKTASGATLYELTTAGDKHNWMIYDLTVGEIK